MEWVSSFVLCWGLFLTESYSFEHTWSHTKRTYFLRSGSNSGASSPFLKHIPTPHQLSQELLVWLAHWLANGFSIIKTISTHIPEHALGRGLSLLPCNWDIKLFIIRLHTTSLPRSTHILWGSLHVRDHSTTGLWPGTLSFPYGFPLGKEAWPSCLVLVRQEYGQIWQLGNVAFSVIQIQPVVLSATFESFMLPMQR